MMSDLENSKDIHLVWLTKGSIDFLNSPSVTLTGWKPWKFPKSNTVGLHLNDLAWSYSDPYKINGFGIFKIHIREPLSPDYLSWQNEPIGDQMTVGLHLNDLQWPVQDIWLWNFQNLTSGSLNPQIIYGDQKNLLVTKWLLVFTWMTFSDPYKIFGFWIFKIWRQGALITRLSLTTKWT